MYCPNCGAPNIDEVKRCGACGTHLDVSEVISLEQDGAAGARITSIAVPPVSSHLLVAMLTTLFCCLPLGMVSLLYASQVQPRFARGDYLGAQVASQRARMWAVLSFFVGLVTMLLPALRGTYLVFGI